MDARELIKKFLLDKEVMQLATVKDGKPWVSNLHYVADKNHNIYWLSKPDRRHSQEIKNHAHVAAAIAVRSPDHPVIGLQIEGQASEVKDKKELTEVMRVYADRFKVSESFYNEFMAGKNPHKMYRLKPENIVLFDEQNFPDDPRQEVSFG